MGDYMASILSGINLTKILSSTNKTISVVRQAIPIYQEVKPIFKNKDLFKKKVIKDTTESIKKEKILETTQVKDINNRSTFDNLTFFQ